MSKAPRVGCGVVLLKDGAILLIQRLRQPEAGSWSLPGGKVDWGEPTPVAAAREVAEELGVVAQDLKLLCVVDLIDQGDGDHWISPVYLADSFTGEPALMEPHKHAAFGWFPLGDLPAPLASSAAVAAQALKTGS
ncbi:NUDIX domain-containing protein [Caulobacter segnis]|uniref:NUDIX domain-containing protein n=1 Tax=Caulobacter segnis TaxID=88688 RepID=UPI00240F1231|nr:NUDIX domain-containing protein [Caulobacter segnis]MDG2522690.1 NUDIX domain-containing protein [Caulobacter segnis]